VSNKDQQYHKWLIETARAQFEREGELEIDDNPKISTASDVEEEIIGSYVAAWIWVDNPHCLICEEFIFGTPVFDKHGDIYCKQCYLKTLLKEE